MDTRLYSGPSAFPLIAITRHIDLGDFYILSLLFKHTSFPNCTYTRTILDLRQIFKCLSYPVVSLYTACTVEKVVTAFFSIICIYSNSRTTISLRLVWIRSKSHCSCHLNHSRCCRCMRGRFYIHECLLF